MVRSFIRLKFLTLSFAAFAGLAAPAAAAANDPPVTVVITHGASGSGTKGIWVETMAQAYIARSGGGSVYRYTGATGALSAVDLPGADGSAHTVIIIFNWVPESAGVAAGPNRHYTQAAGAALAALLMEPAYTAHPGPLDLLTNRALHLIGHSRGPCVISHAVQRLGAWGIAVDHVTSLDAHPVDGTLDWPYNPNWGDETPVRWSNVTFADNYWRADGPGFINGLDFDGIPIADTFNLELDEDALECCAYTFSHSDVHLWYHGTIDLADTVCDGEQCINLAARMLWFADGWTETGFSYAHRGGGAAMRPAMPGPGFDPGSVPSLYAGNFAIGSWAGWSYHGGGGSGAIVAFSGGHALRLTPGGNTFASNHFWLTGQDGLLAFALHTASTASDGVLRVEVEPYGESPQVIASVDLSGVSLDMYAPVRLAVPDHLLERRARIRFVLEPGSGSGAVHIDDIEFSERRLGDLNLDGVVNVSDLLLMLSSWGPCSEDCPPACAADLNGDCQVDIADLLLLLTNWGDGD